MVSVNQVRHMFVANGTTDGTALAVKGDLLPAQTADGKAAYIKYIGEGGQITSDLIKLDQIISAKKTVAATLAIPLKEAVLQLDSNVNGGLPVAGQDYLVDVVVSNYIALGDENTLVKFAAAHATTGMSASDLYLALAKSLARNFSRDISKLFNIYLADNLSSTSGWELVTVNSAHSGTYVGIVLSEKDQIADYVRGEFAVSTVNFKVVPHTVIVNGDEMAPFVVESDGTVALAAKESTAVDSVTAIGDGYALADTEFFCMGERGDIYRQVGYPRTIRTKYMIDPAATYDVIDINFYFVGRGVSCQKSEKLLTIVCPAAVTSAIVSALGTVGITVS